MQGDLAVEEGAELLVADRDLFEGERAGLGVGGEVDGALLALADFVEDGVWGGGDCYGLRKGHGWI